MKGGYSSPLVGVAFAALLAGPSSTFAATAPDLGQAEGFGVLGASAVTSTGPTVITGHLGISPSNASSVTGFSFSSAPGPGQVMGATHFADAVAVGAQNDVTAAYTISPARCATRRSRQILVVGRSHQVCTVLRRPWG